jgi:hypothetical protein
VILRGIDDKKVFTGKSLNVKVPSHGGKTSTIRRQRNAVREIVNKAVTQAEYRKTLTLLITQVEDYISYYLRIILIAYPDRLALSTKGNEGGIAFPLNDVVSANSIKDLIRNPPVRDSRGIPLSARM